MTAVLERPVTLGKHTQDDAVLLRRVLAGDRESFGRIVEKYQALILSVCRHHVRDEEAARDLAQDCFSSAYFALSTLKELNSCKAWLVKIAVNLCRNHLRRGKIVKMVPLDSSQFDVAAPAEAEPATLDPRIARAIESLPEIYRETFLLRHLYSKSYEEIAAALDISVKNVDMRLLRARRMLMDKLKPQS